MLPEQLKYDVIRTAQETGFYDQADFFRNKFGIDSIASDPNEGDLVFFWLNGFGPVKAEWGLTFTNTPGDIGWGASVTM